MSKKQIEILKDLKDVFEKHDISFDAIPTPRFLSM
jgi:hypothetical protein